MRPQVSVEAVGLFLTNAMRELYHYSCQFRDSPSERTAALLAVFLFVEELRGQVYDNFEDACKAEDYDPQIVLQRLPPEMTELVRTFFDDFIAHTDEPRPRPFVFHQRGSGSA